MSERYRIIEEVPGVPEHEKWFVTGPDIKAPYPSFYTLTGAKHHLIYERNVPEDQIDIEREIDLFI